ncbi:hypothetical protein DFR69_10556 [Nocardia neocaledoniensis]|uniref:Uncharacterized protein n=1 Tax=Nocardia neocaledoniensis TaxID=236511 RepID=A0A317NIQ8_9NOCA|nr:hypothetical protein DFR69_10556 [Nocardia neocaledoniensis]
MTSSTDSRCRQRKAFARCASSSGSVRSEVLVPDRLGWWSSGGPRSAAAGVPRPGDASAVSASGIVLAWGQGKRGICGPCAEGAVVDGGIFPADRGQGVSDAGGRDSAGAIGDWDDRRVEQACRGEQGVQFTDRAQGSGCRVSNTVDRKVDAAGNMAGTGEDLRLAAAAKRSESGAVEGWSASGSAKSALASTTTSPGSPRRSRSQETDTTWGMDRPMLTSDSAGAQCFPNRHRAYCCQPREAPPAVLPDVLVGELACREGAFGSGRPAK